MSRCNLTPCLVAQSTMGWSSGCVCLTARGAWSSCVCSGMTGRACQQLSAMSSTWSLRLSMTTARWWSTGKQVSGYPLFCAPSSAPPRARAFRPPAFVLRLSPGCCGESRRERNQRDGMQVALDRADHLFGAAYPAFRLRGPAPRPSDLGHSDRPVVPGAGPQNMGHTPKT